MIACCNTATGYTGCVTSEEFKHASTGEEIKLYLAKTLCLRCALSSHAQHALHPFLDMAGTETIVAAMNRVGEVKSKLDIAYSDVLKGYPFQNPLESVSKTAINCIANPRAE